MADKTTSAKNQDIQVEQIGQHLEGKTIALCVTGGIAAIETPKIARHLRRYGAEVHAYASGTAFQFVGKAALEWATGRPVVDQLSGLAEHICHEDLVLVAPATLNTINKIMAGIADNPITTLISSALGKRIPIYLAPTMHESMFNNPILKKNLSQANQYGISIIPPRIGEGKSKMPRLEAIVDQVCRGLASGPLKYKKILITGGPTPAKIDDARRIVSKFKGVLSVLIAQEAYRRGADITLLLGSTGIEVPSHLHAVYHHDFEEYRSQVHAQLSTAQSAGKPYAAGVFSAAVADFAPSQPAKGKISSELARLDLTLLPTPKIISEVRSAYPELFMATFKYEIGISEEELLSIARGRIGEGYQLVIANREEDMKKNHQAYIVGKDGVLYKPATKREIANNLMDALETELPKWESQHVPIKDSPPIDSGVPLSNPPRQADRSLPERIVDGILEATGLTLTPYC